MVLHKYYLPLLSCPLQNTVILSCINKWQLLFQPYHLLNASSQLAAALLNVVHALRLSKFTSISNVCTTSFLEVNITSACIRFEFLGIFHIFYRSSTPFANFYCRFLWVTLISVFHLCIECFFCRCSM